MRSLIQCVPNFSEGRRADVIAAIVDAVRITPDVRLVDWSADTDHNRAVVTFVGPPAAVAAAALAACAVAVNAIDVGNHRGVHPRLGAVDVLPFVPLSGISLAECATLARAVGQELAAQHDLPVFLYEGATDEGRALPAIRKAAFRTLAPDYGPPRPHPSAGVVVVGARGPLIAYNINLATPNPGAAREIARELRSGVDAVPFPGIRALGLSLKARGLTQVSMNITRPAETSLLSVFAYVERRAKQLGTHVVESEVIGALPAYTAFSVLADALQAPSLKPGQILWENRHGSERELPDP